VIEGTAWSTTSLYFHEHRQRGNPSSEHRL
jgi:hypothetical protein